MTMGTSLPSAVRTFAPIDCGVLCAEFEDVTNLHGFENFQHAMVAARARFTCVDRAQISPAIDFNVAFDIDAANVMVVFVGAGGHVATTLKPGVGHDQQILI